MTSPEDYAIPDKTQVLRTDSFASFLALFNFIFFVGERNKNKIESGKCNKDTKLIPLSFWNLRWGIKTHIFSVL